LTTYHKLSAQYDALYRTHLEAFKERLAHTYCDYTKYTDFYPSIGVQSGKPVEFILYGQSVGGWQREHDYQERVPEDRVAKSNDYSNDRYADHSPLDWVNVLRAKRNLAELDEAGREFYKPFGHYNPGKSPFWQLIMGVIREKYGIEQSSWSWTDNLVWSNLYKIAPQDGKCYNPDEGERILQRPECVGLVEQELRELRPKYCIVYTNDAWWAPFRKGLRTELLKAPAEGHVQRVERWEETKIIVVKRARVGSRAAVDHVLEYLD